MTFGNGVGPKMTRVLIPRPKVSRLYGFVQVCSAYSGYYSSFTYGQHIRDNHQCCGIDFCSQKATATTHRNNIHICETCNKWFQALNSIEILDGTSVKYALKLICDNCFKYSKNYENSTNGNGDDTKFSFEEFSTNTKNKKCECNIQ